MTATLQQRLAASALIVTCERICADARLPENEEQNLRRLIVKCCNAFEIATIAERESEPESFAVDCRMTPHPIRVGEDALS